MNTPSDRNAHDLENELHRANCAECSKLWDELESISAEAARLPMLAPSRDLWDGIEARITTVPRTLPFYKKQAFRLAIAATLLIAVTSGVTWQIAKTNSMKSVVAESSSLPASEELTGSDDAAQLHQASFSASVTQMEREIATLQNIVTERRSELDPRTIAVLEANLKLIDTAIEESRAALASDPASQFLSSQFTRAYTSKLTLLREVATLPTGI